jgi:hypothetical protein
MPSKDLAPQGRVPDLRKRLQEFAEKNSLFLNPKFDWKIAWMEEHEGRCFCDWENRFCPCGQALEDLKRFNGCCHCGVLCTEEKLHYYLTQKPRKKPSPEEAKERKAKLKERQKENEKVYDRLFKKKEGRKEV